MLRKKKEGEGKFLEGRNVYQKEEEGERKRSGKGLRKRTSVRTFL